MTLRSSLLALTSVVALTMGVTAASAKVQLRYLCSNDANECEVFADLIKRFEKENPDIGVVTETVPYKTILEGLPVQLAAGGGPDLSRVTDLGGLSRHYLDLKPYVKADYYEQNFGSTLPWLRPSQEDKGIYGIMSQLTMVGPFVNRTLFEQAKVPVPSGKVSWDQWAEAAGKVAKATDTKFAMAMDRSGHRFAGAAVAQGAKLVSEDQKPVFDTGFKTMTEKFVGWHKAGLMPMDLWGATGGAAYRDAFEEFKNGNAVVFISGSWQIGKLEKDIKDAFDWSAVPNPCGETVCAGMPGGSAFVGFKYTKHPAEVAKVIDFMAREDIYREYTQRTRQIPAHLGLAKAGLSYPGASPDTEAALKVFTADVAKLAPAAYSFQGYRFNRAIMNATVQRIGQVLNNEMTVDQAIDRIRQDVDTAIQAGK